MVRSATVCLVSFRSRLLAVVPVALLVAGTVLTGTAGSQVAEPENTPTELDPTEPMTLLIDVVDPGGDKCLAASQVMISGSNLYGYLDEDIAPLTVRFDMYNAALAYAIPTLPEGARATAATVATGLVDINQQNRVTNDFRNLRQQMRTFFESNVSAVDSTMAALLDGCAEFDGYPRVISLDVAANDSWDVI